MVPRKCDAGRPGNPAGLGAAVLVILSVLVLPLPAAGQPWEDTGSDAVESFVPGTGAGHGADHLPGNVLGLPDPIARSSIATVSPGQVLSLGVGGEIILRFDRHPIVDLPGPDFTVFENAFYYVIAGKEHIYAEPAEVAVSRDGVTFTAFPFDSLTLKGCAGVTPTNGDRNPGDPAVSGGDHFDLGQLGIDSVRFVRIRDVSAIIINDRKHPFWDPTLTGAAPTAGFDLDAVVRVSGSSVTPSGSGVERGGGFAADLFPNPFAGASAIRLRLERAADVCMRLFDPVGRHMRTLTEGRLERGEWRVAVDATDLPAGIYFILVEVDGHAPYAIRALHRDGGR